MNELYTSPFLEHIHKYRDVDIDSSARGKITFISFLFSMFLGFLVENKYMDAIHTLAITYVFMCVRME